MFESAAMFESVAVSDCGAPTEAARGEYWMILHERLVAGAKQRLALEAAQARDLVYAEEAELWRRFGYMSMHEYMQRELFYEGHTARERPGLLAPSRTVPCPVRPCHDHTAPTRPRELRQARTVRRRSRPARRA